MRPFLLGYEMTYNDLYDLIADIELEEKYLFVVRQYKQIGIDVLDYETEDELDGGWFDTIEEAYEFIKEYEGSL